MSQSLNKVCLIGNLGADPELKYVPSGKTVCNISLATNEGIHENKRTVWHRLTFWDKLAELCGQYLHKGSKIYIEGRLTYRTYEGKNGTTDVTEIVVNTLVFLDKRDESDRETGQEGKATQEEPQEELPF